mmetsp:Transcript_13086/g.20557  ORF Transcript_13086/g.20557 Transcript_13086/m.20557 type:complete len:145 (+) Transcript_13086:137-571(+)
MGFCIGFGFLLHKLRNDSVLCQWAHSAPLIHMDHMYSCGASVKGTHLDHSPCPDQLCLGVDAHALSVGKKESRRKVQVSEKQLRSSGGKKRHLEVANDESSYGRGAIVEKVPREHAKQVGDTSKRCANGNKRRKTGLTSKKGRH